MTITHPLGAMMLVASLLLPRACENDFQRQRREDREWSQNEQYQKFLRECDGSKPAQDCR